MRFVAISDTHSHHKSVKLPKGDVLLHAGDVTYRGKKTEVLDFLEWFSNQPFKYKIFIAGNHDFYFEKENPSTVQAIIPEGIIYLQDSGTEINGIRIWGTPITPWFHHWAFNRLRGTSINKHWQLIPQNTDLLLTHGPSYGILDAVINGQHVGCKDLLKRIMEVKPKFHVYGHIHEAYGIKKQNGITFINACVVNESYELVNKPFVFEL
ncbi:MAG: metallophosphatase domain-containing protein [Flavisolibacter sp.]|nr:metallophosphatase domain-containing protein [Flavisolibacter sp.]